MERGASKGGLPLRALGMDTPETVKVGIRNGSLIANEHTIQSVDRIPLRWTRAASVMVA